MKYTSAEDSGITPEVLLTIPASLSTEAITALTLACELCKTACSKKDVCPKYLFLNHTKMYYYFIKMQKQSVILKQYHTILGVLLCLFLA